MQADAKKNPSTPCDEILRIEKKHEKKAGNCVTQRRLSLVHLRSLNYVSGILQQSLLSSGNYHIEVL
jgi:hypothetical protein